MNEATAVEKKKRERGTGRIWKLGFRAEPDEGDPKHAVWKKRVWWIQYYDTAGRGRRESSRSTTYKVAEKLLQRRLAEREAGTLPAYHPHNLSYETLRDAYYAEYKEQERKSMRFDREGKPRLDKVVRLDGFFTGYRVSMITSEALHKFIDKLKNEGYANQSINHSLAALKHMFRMAVREKRLSIALMPYFPMLDVRKTVREGFLKHEEFQKLRSELPDYLRCPFTLAYHSGMRRGEIFNLRWSDIDFKAEQIRLEETKNSEKRTIPLGRDVLLMLKVEREKYPRAEFVFMRESSKGAKRVLSFRKAWASACKRAGVSDTLFHDLRRCGVRNLTRSGVPRVVAMRISGHKTESIFRRYDIVDGEDLKRAVSQTDDYLAKLDAEMELEKRVAELEKKTVTVGAFSGQIADSAKPKTEPIN